MFTQNESHVSTERKHNIRKQRVDMAWIVGADTAGNPAKLLADLTAAAHL